MADNDRNHGAERDDPVYAVHGVTSLSVLFLFACSILQIAGVVGLLIVNTLGYLDYFGAMVRGANSFALDIFLILLSAQGYFKGSTDAYKKFFGTPTFARMLVGSVLDIAATVMIVSTVALWIIR